MSNRIETFQWRFPEAYDANMAMADLEWFVGEYDGHYDTLEYTVLDDHTIQIVDTREFVEALVKEVGGSL